MWKLTYDAPVGYRMKKRFLWVTTDNLWYSYDRKEWDTLENIKYNCSTSDDGPSSVKAFERYLQKHPELKGHKVTLVSKYHYEGVPSLDVHAHWEEDE